MAVVGLIITWVVYVVLALLTFLLSFLFVKYYSDNYEEEKITTVTTALSITLGACTLLLIPLDIYDVSSLTDHATGLRLSTPGEVAARGTAVQVFYYLLMLGQVCMVFVVTPFSYFYFEADSTGATWRSRCCSGVKYTVIFAVLLVILVVVGVLLQGNVTNSNHFLQSLLGTDTAENAVSFVLASVTLLGYILWVTYVAFGFSSLPIGFIKGAQPVREEEAAIRSEVQETRRQRRQLRSNVLAGRSKRRRQDEESLSLLERKERVLNERSERLGRVGVCVRRCGNVMRPFSIVIGILLFLCSLIVMVSTLLSTIDKLSAATHSFILANPFIFNPIDQVLVLSSRIFPLDYVLFLLVVFFIFSCIWSSILRVGIRLLWVQLFTIRAQRTPPQALLLASIIVALATFALVFQLSTLAPRYFNFGSQVFFNETLGGVIPCSFQAPPANCSMTQVGRLVNTVQLRFGFFAVVFYWVNWLFIAAWIVGIVVALCLKRKSVLQATAGELEDDELYR